MSGETAYTNEITVLTKGGDPIVARMSGGQVILCVPPVTTSGRCGGLTSGEAMTLAGALKYLANLLERTAEEPYGMQEFPSFEGR